MSSDNRDYSIYKVFIGDVPADGSTMPLETAMELIGHNIKPDSASITKEDDSFKLIKNQEDQTTDMQVLTEVGNVIFAFETWDFNFENLVNALGGSIVDGVWKEPVNAYSGKEVALRIVSKSGKGLHAITDFPRSKMTGKVNGIMSESEPGSVMFNFSKLTPQNASDINQSAIHKWYKPAAATNPITDDTADTFGWDNVDNFTDFSDYEYSINGGAAYSDCTANPQTGITTAVPVGDLLVRVKENLTATNKYKSGYTLANTEEFTV